MTKVIIDGTEYDFRFSVHPPDVRLVLGNGKTAVLTFADLMPGSFPFKTPPAFVERHAGGWRAVYPEEPHVDHREIIYTPAARVNQTGKILDGDERNPKHGKTVKVTPRTWCKLRFVPWAPGEDLTSDVGSAQKNPKKRQSAPQKRAQAKRAKERAYIKDEDKPAVREFFKKETTGSFNARYQKVCDWLNGKLKNRKDGTPYPPPPSVDHAIKPHVVMDIVRQSGK